MEQGTSDTNSRPMPQHWRSRSDSSSINASPEFSIVRPSSSEPKQETRRLLSSSSEPPQYPFLEKKHFSPLSGRKLRRFPSPLSVFRSPKSPISPLNRSISERQVNVDSDAQSLPFSFGTRSMILPTTSPSYFQQNENRLSVSSSSSRPPSLVESITHPFHNFSFSGGRISRSSTRRSFGKEWTTKHWTKLKGIENESERARRCSKLSSGFAPLMVFGGLVFLCIGISAATNGGKDKEKLQNLSSTPMAMGIFMLILGAVLVVTWVGCRARAKSLDKQVLHGSRRNSEIPGNVIQNLMAKLHSPLRNSSQSPSLPGVTLDGVDILKPPSVANTQSHSNLDSVFIDRTLQRLNRPQRFNLSPPCGRNGNNSNLVPAAPVI